MWFPSNFLQSTYISDIPLIPSYFNISILQYGRHKPTALSEKVTGILTLHISVQKYFWGHRICKNYPNSSVKLVLMMVFIIHCNYFIILIVFFVFFFNFLHDQAPKKLGIPNIKCAHLTTLDINYIWVKLWIWNNIKSKIIYLSVNIELGLFYVMK